MVLAESAVQKTGKQIRLHAGIGYVRRPDAIDLEYSTNGVLLGKACIVQTLGHVNPTEEKLDEITILLAAVMDCCIRCYQLETRGNLPLNIIDFHEFLVIIICNVYHVV